MSLGSSQGHLKTCCSCWMSRCCVMLCSRTLQRAGGTGCLHLQVKVRRRQQASLKRRHLPKSTQCHVHYPHPVCAEPRYYVPMTAHNSRSTCFTTPRKLVPWHTTNTRLPLLMSGTMVLVQNGITLSIVVLSDSVCGILSLMNLNFGLLTISL